MILIFERLYFKDLLLNYWFGKRERKVKNKYIFMIIGNLCIKKIYFFSYLYILKSGCILKWIYCFFEYWIW